MVKNRIKRPKTTTHLGAGTDPLFDKNKKHFFIKNLVWLQQPQQYSHFIISNA